MESKCPHLLPAIIYIVAFLILKHKQLRLKLSVSIKRIIYKFLNVRSFDYAALEVSGKVWYPYPSSNYI